MGQHDDDDRGDDNDKGNTAESSVNDRATPFALVVVADAAAAASSQKATTISPYERRKPKWWRQLTTKPSKAQRHAIAAMQHYQLTPPSYGNFYDWDIVFANVLVGPAVSSLLSSPRKNIVMEIGFGAGDNLLCLTRQSALANDNVCYVGCEVHKASIGKLCRRVQQSLDRQAFWMGYTEYRHSNAVFTPKTTTTTTDCWDDNDDVSHAFNAYNNLRITGNAIHALRFFVPPASLHRIVLAFPDPFPQHERGRILQDSTLGIFHRSLHVGGTLCLATDHVGFYQDAATLMAAHSDHWMPVVLPGPDRRSWLPVVSVYEAKGWREGRATLIAVWQRRT